MTRYFMLKTGNIITDADISVAYEAVYGERKLFDEIDGICMDFRGIDGEIKFPTAEMMLKFGKESLAVRVYSETMNCTISEARKKVKVMSEEIEEMDSATKSSYADIILKRPVSAYKMPEQPADFVFPDAGTGCGLESLRETDGVSDDEMDIDKISAIIESDTAEIINAGNIGIDVECVADNIHDGCDADSGIGDAGADDCMDGGDSEYGEDTYSGYGDETYIDGAACSDDSAYEDDTGSESGEMYDDGMYDDEEDEYYEQEYYEDGDYEEEHISEKIFHDAEEDSSMTQTRKRGFFKKFFSWMMFGSSEDDGYDEYDDECAR